VINDQAMVALHGVYYCQFVYACVTFGGELASKCSIH